MSEKNKKPKKIEMKVSDLIKLLEQYGDFYVNICVQDEYLDEIIRASKPDSLQWPSWRRISITGISDICYSDKSISLDGEIMF